MAKITMELIKELREKTQVGMMDCKKALIQADGDIERAIEILRKKGAAVAAKRADNATNNGRITSYISPDHKLAALLEISCETDFSANTSDMKEFSETVCEHLAKTAQCCEGRCEPECLIEQTLFNNKDKTVKMLLDELIAKISENIKITRCTRVETGDKGLINVYIHPGANLGTIIELEVDGLTDQNREQIAQLAKDLCMQIAAFNPVCIDPESLDQKVIEKEQCILKEQLKSSGKPEEIIEKIVLGRMNKFYEEVCLLKQKCFKDDKISVEKYIAQIGKDANCTISIKQFQRFAIGK